MAEQKEFKNPNTEAQKARATEVMLMYKDAYTFKQQAGLFDEWSENEDYWAGEINEPEDADDPGSNTNIIQPIIESQVADLVESEVDISVKGIEPSDNIFASDVQQWFRWLWKHNTMPVKLDRHERQRLKFGTGVWKVYYDPLARKKRGMVVIDALNPVNFFVDPKCTDPMNLDDADFVIHAVPRSLKWLVRRFGKVAKAVKPEMSFQYSTTVFSDEQGSEFLNTGKNRALLLECWERNENGALTRTFVANGVLLEESNPDESFYAHGKYPFVVTPCYRREGIFWGLSDIALLKPIQDMINDLDDQIRLNARLMGNLQIVVGIASGINLKKWTATAGLKIPATDPNAWKQVNPPNIPVYIPGRRQEGFREAEIVSGRTDAVEGRSVGSVRAASGIMALQEAGNRRVMHKKLMTQMGLIKVLELSLEYFKEFFTVEDAYRIIGKEESTPESYVWLRGSDLKKIPKLVPKVNYESETTLLGPLLDDNGAPMHKEAEFDLDVSIGAGLPGNKAFLYQAVLELHREGLITTEEGRLLLKEVVSWPLIDPLTPIGSFRGTAMPQQNGAAMMGQEQMLGLDPGTLMPEQAQMMGQQAPPTQGAMGMSPEIMQQLASMLGGTG